jgi:hypothetical protein
VRPAPEDPERDRERIDARDCLADVVVERPQPVFLGAEEVAQHRAERVIRVELVGDGASLAVGPDHVRLREDAQDVADRLVGHAGARRELGGRQLTSVVRELAQNAHRRLRAQQRRKRVVEEVLGDRTHNTFCLRKNASSHRKRNL